jgi:hypothetical protein
MIFSVHIPTTAGTSFRNALKSRYGDRLALYYGARDKATHPLLRVPRQDLASRIPLLEEHGIEVLHGHYYLRLVKDAVDDPSTQIWTWLRDPLERVWSHYSFIKERKTKWSFDKEIKAGQLSLIEFAKKKRIRNMYAEYLHGFELKDLAFVGVSERFELGLAMLFGDGAPKLPRRYNAVHKRVALDARTRAQLRAVTRRDEDLYVEALRMTIDRLASLNAIETHERPAAAGTDIVRRLIRKVS